MITNHELRPSIKPYVQEFSKTDFNTQDHQTKMEKAGEGITVEDVMLCKKHADDFKCFERFIKTKKIEEPKKEINKLVEQK